MNTITYVAIVLQAMFILCALAEIKAVLLQILDELKKARKE